MNQVCEGCGGRLTGPGRSDRRHHNSQCRKMAFLRRQLERQAPELTQPPPTHAEPTHALDREALLEEALSEPRLLVYVARAAQTNWRASAWLLERRYPERWGARRRELELAVPREGDPFAELDELAARRRRHPVND
jgi:hypothetical protein